MKKESEIAKLNRLEREKGSNLIWEPVVFLQVIKGRKESKQCLRD